MDDLWTLVHFESIDGRCPMVIFLDELPDEKFAALDSALTKVLALRGISLAGTKWMTSLGRGLHEFRVRHSEKEIAGMFISAGHRVPLNLRRTSVLLRVFVHFHGDKKYLLLNGYDKGRDSSVKRQQREIAKARRFLADFQQRPKG